MNRCKHPGCTNLAETVKIFPKTHSMCTKHWFNEKNNFTVATVAVKVRSKCVYHRRLEEGVEVGRLTGNEWSDERKPRKKDVEKYHYI